MEIRQLEYFVAVAELGSFTQAAQACHVVQTTVSHSVASLEQELGVRLFARSGRAVSLTPEGQAFLPDARSIVERVRLAEQNLARARTSGGRVLRLGYYGAGLAEDFPETVRRFRAETGCQVSLRGADAQTRRNDLAPEVRLGLLDAFIIAHAPIPEYDAWAVQRVVAYNNVYLAMAEDDALAVPQAIRMAELGGIAGSICMFRASHTGEYGDAMRGWLAEAFGIDSSVVTWNDSLEDVNLLARCGQCRTVAFRNDARDSFGERGLTYRRIEGLGLLPITMTWSRTGQTSLAGTFATVARRVASRHGIDVEHARR